MQRGLGAVRRESHLPLQDGEHLTVHLIHLVIVPDHASRGVHIVAHEGIQAVPHHPSDKIPHGGKVERDRQRVVGPQPARALGDVDRDVPHALQVVVYLQHGDDVPQVTRDGLMQGQHLEALHFDFDLALVDPIVSLQNAPGEGRPAMDDRLDGVIGCILHKGAQGEDLLGETIEVASEMD